MDIALVGDKTYPQQWLPLLRERLPQDRFFIYPDLDDPAQVKIALVGSPQAGELDALPNLQLVQCLWMGVDRLLNDRSLPRDVPLARMVDPSMVNAMTEIVLAWVIDFHRSLHQYRQQQAQGRWACIPQRIASDRTVGILGLGELGRAAAQALNRLGFNVCGWSRTQKSIPGIACHSSRQGLDAVLRQSDVLVCLLPLTSATHGLLSRPVFERMKRGAALISLGRGAQMVTADLLTALDSGQLEYAYLDVFEDEPLPENHVLWTHRQVSITPHIAARTEVRTAINVAVENIDRVRRGERPMHLVDLEAGY